MSSRALRRVQRELEEKKQLEILAQENANDEQESDEEEEAAPAVQPAAKPSLFSMLGDVDDENEDDSADDAEVQDHSDPTEQEVAPPPKPSKKGKKKRKKGKGKNKLPAPEQTATSAKAVHGLDEIDRALLALNLTSNTASGADDHQTSPATEEMQQLFSVLAIDKQHLHAANEMRKLFGRAAVQGNADEDEPRARNRHQQGGLAAAVGGRNNAGGRNLASLGLRRNIFIQGKEEWPRATLGGLGMEIVEKGSDGTVEYRFVHSPSYQLVQLQFETCVASIDPERMIQLLHNNPYHISTLLQVSEIAKQQRDNAASGDLLERALFAFGRAVHSTFSNNLAQGKARLDFRRPENREFGLAVWRYIATLGIRATWRTSFEWAKLLISLSPEDDPYCMRLMVDQLALRGREPQALVDLIESDHLQRAWKIPPNLAYSMALAHDRLKQPSKARTALRSAIKEYPWIASRICKELDISPIPKSVWAKEPNDNHQELLAQLYVPHAKDLWNTTESTSLLVEVCYSIEDPLGAGKHPYWLAHINELDLARHIVLSDDRSLIALLDPLVKSRYTSTSDPLPPDDNLVSYSLTSIPPNRSSSRDRAIAFELEEVDLDSNRTYALTELEQLRVYFESINVGRYMDDNADPTREDLLRALEDAGTSFEEFRRNTERVHQVRHRLQDLGLEVVFERAEQGGEEESDTDG